MCLCNQIADKKRLVGGWFVIHSEECGANAKYKLVYELKNKEIIKTVCKRHLTSNTKWLDKINVKYIINNL